MLLNKTNSSRCKSPIWELYHKFMNRCSALFVAHWQRLMQFFSQTQIPCISVRGLLFNSSKTFLGSKVHLFKETYWYEYFGGVTCSQTLKGWCDFFSDQRASNFPLWLTLNKTFRETKFFGKVTKNFFVCFVFPLLKVKKFFPKPLCFTFERKTDWEIFLRAKNNPR